MRETYRSSLFRCLVCLILVCCILVNLSPVRAEALPLSTWVWLEASMVFASLFAGLGVSPVDELASGFREACDACWDFISLNYDFVTDDQKIAAWSTGSDELPFMIDQELVEAVRDWLFSSGTLVDESAGAGFAYFNGFRFPLLPEYDPITYPYLAICHNNYSNVYQLYASDLPLGSTKQSSSSNYVNLCNLNSSNANFLIWTITERDYSTVSSWGQSTSTYFTSNYKPSATRTLWLWSNYDITNTDGSIVWLATSPPPSDTLTFVYDEENLELNYVAPSSEDFTTGYSDWAAGAISVPGIRSKEEEKEVVVPLSIPGTAADVYSFAQTDVWTGANTAADVIAQAVPIPGTDTGDPSVPSVPEVPAEVAPYTFSLNDIFPFCIPFDLYDFLTCLDATPVAPVINWQIQLPGGSTYPLTVDLSAFDSVAELLRKLELLVFSIALALKTRDLIKG